MNPNPASYGGNPQGQPPQTYQETAYPSNQQSGSNPNNYPYNPNPYPNNVPPSNPYGAPPPAAPGAVPYDPYSVAPTVSANPGNPYPYPNTAPPANPYPNNVPVGAANPGNPYPYPNNVPPANPYSYPGNVPLPRYNVAPPVSTPPSSGRKLVLIGLAVLVVLGGLVAFIGVSAHNTEVATENAHATATTDAKAHATATAQVYATATAIASTYPFSTNLKLDDPITDNGKGFGWLNGTWCQFASDGYHVSETAVNTYFICPALKTDFTDFTYQISMKITRGDLAGISFRGNDNQSKYYTFVFSQTDGMYWLLLYSQKGQKPQTLYNNSTSYFQAHQANQLSVVARGSKIALYVNGHELTSVTDSTLGSGQIGTAVYNGTNTGDVVEATFSNAKVWQL